MAKRKHLALIKQGIPVWNRWRKNNPKEKPDLSEANLSGAELSEADLSGAYIKRADLSGADLFRADLFGADLREAKLIRADFRGANLKGAYLKGVNLRGANLSEAHIRGANLFGSNLFGANLIRADFRGANLSEAYLRRVDLSGADLRRANLFEADLKGANIRESNLSEANLRRANLFEAQLVNSNLSLARMLETNLENTNLTGCRIYGISAWNLKINEETAQLNLTITQPKEPTITVDNLEVGQFIYLLLNNKKIRHFIDTIISKFVLILGRFTAKRKALLDAIREELRNRGYLPISFDSKGPINQDIRETISTLAHMSRFIIADITDARSIPQELQFIVPNLVSVPVQPLLQSSEKEYSMFEKFKRYHWVLALHRYKGIDDLIATLGEKVVVPAEKKVLELKK